MFRSANVTVMVHDVQKSVEFYTKSLGLTLTVSYGQEWAELEAPGLRIGLHRLPSGQNVVQGSLSIGFEVRDLDAAVKALEKKGLRFSVRKESHIQLAFFSDPDGTPLYLAQVKKY